MLLQNQLQIVKRSGKAVLINACLLDDAKIYTSTLSSIRVTRYQYFKVPDNRTTLLWR